MSDEAYAVTVSARPYIFRWVRPTFESRAEGVKARAAAQARRARKNAARLRSWTGLRAFAQAAA